jgi:NhaP-type Na+/H+ or K+/H+ antiporter
MGPADVGNSESGPALRSSKRAHPKEPAPMNAPASSKRAHPKEIAEAPPVAAEVVEEKPHVAEEVQEHPHGELEEEELAKYVVVPIGLAIIASLFLGGLLEKHEISWFPESAVTLLIGVGLGLYMKSAIGHHEFFKSEEVFNTTCSTLLTLFLLPILIFESGFSVRVKDFASQFEYIMLFAVVGSLISFLVVGSLILASGNLGFHGITWPRTAFAYASLIAATDPVATLATYSKLQVDPLLNILVFGDSTFNDAVAIVLFKVLNSNEIMGTPDSRPAAHELTMQILGGIVKIFFGSVAVGLLSAALFLLLLRFFDMREAPRLEILALVAVGYVTFAVGEVVGMSGIIATVFCSILLGIYARPHLSSGGSLLGSFFIKQVANLMDTSVFLLTGFCVVELGPNGWVFGSWVMVFCLFGRAAAVFPVTFIVNAIKRRRGKAHRVPVEDMHLISRNAMIMMWHAGLRGAISLTLCMQLGEWVDILDGPGTRHILQTGTYLLICVFLLVFGGSTESSLKKLGIPMGTTTDQDKLYKSEVPALMQSTVAHLDENFMTPIFVGHRADVKEPDRQVVAEDVLKVAGF